MNADKASLILAIAFMTFMLLFAVVIAFSPGREVCLSGTPRTAIEAGIESGGEDL